MKRWMTLLLGCLLLRAGRFGLRSRVLHEFGGHLFKSRELQATRSTGPSCFGGAAVRCVAVRTHFHTSSRTRHVSRSGGQRGGRWARAVGGSESVVGKVRRMGLVPDGPLLPAVQWRQG